MKEVRREIAGKELIELYESMGDSHAGSGADTPLRPDAFDISDEEKVEKIAHHFREIMLTLGLDLEDDSLKGTPYRVASSYVYEFFSGLNPVNKPKISLFENKYQYDQMLVEKNITLFSNCEHHFVPIMGKVHVGYFPRENGIIGLSKINRIVQYYGRRPQVQERLTMQIYNELSHALQTDDIAVVVNAKHLCVITRGVKDTASSTVTSVFRGKFENRSIRDEFLHYIDMNISCVDNKS